MSRRHQPYGKEEGKSNKIKNGYGPIKEKDRGLYFFLKLFEFLRIRKKKIFLRIYSTLNF